MAVVITLDGTGRSGIRSGGNKGASRLFTNLRSANMGVPVRANTLKDAMDATSPGDVMTTDVTATTATATDAITPTTRATTTKTPPHIRNRRYVALHRLLLPGGYFTLDAMRTRHPAAYAEIVEGRATATTDTDRAGDEYDEAATLDVMLARSAVELEVDGGDAADPDVQRVVAHAFSSVLSRQQEIRRQERVTSSTLPSPASTAEEAPARAPGAEVWPLTSSMATHAPTSVHLNDDSDDAVREFTRFMYELYLDGLDTSLDYADIDENEAYVDEREEDRLREEAYFATSDEDDEGEGCDVEGAATCADTGEQDF